jgi:hypothetical protein
MGGACERARVVRERGRANKLGGPSKDNVVVSGAGPHDAHAAARRTFSRWSYSAFSAMASGSQSSQESRAEGFVQPRKFRCAQKIPQLLFYLVERSAARRSDSAPAETPTSVLRHATSSGVGGKAARAGAEGQRRAGGWGFCDRLSLRQDVPEAQGDRHGRRLRRRGCQAGCRRQVRARRRRAQSERRERGPHLLAKAAQGPFHHGARRSFVPAPCPHASVHSPPLAPSLAGKPESTPRPRPSASRCVAA